MNMLSIVNNNYYHKKYYMNLFNELVFYIY